MTTKKVPLGLLTARQFAVECEQKGLPISQEHALWVLEQGFIKPISAKEGVAYYNEYQLYAMDLIHERRLQSLEFPKKAQLSRAGKKVALEAPPIGWQKYLSVCKPLIVADTNKWQPVACFLQDARTLRNAFVIQAQKNKEGLEDDDKLRLPFGDAWRAILRYEGPEKAKVILDSHPELSEEVLRYWMEHGLPARVIRHNVTMLLSAEIPALWRILERNESKLSTIFTYGDPTRLSNTYLRMIQTLHFFLSCLNEGKEPPVHEVFNKRYVECVCAVCGDKFIPTQKRGGKPQTLCGKESCNREKRRRAESSRRLRRK